MPKWQVFDLGSNYVEQISMHRISMQSPYLSGRAGSAACAAPSQDQLLYVRFSRPSNLYGDESWLCSHSVPVKLILPVPFREIHCTCT